MIKPRIIETNEGIQNEVTAEIFDRFAKMMRDKGWNNVDGYIKRGISGGNVLEMGPGPGYIGLEWLKKTNGESLIGCEISPEMIKRAEKNAGEYGLHHKTKYILGNCMEMPFGDNCFDAVISNGSLHEWENPVIVFNEIYRVLKNNGLFCITDMRRDVSPLLKWFIYASTKPKEIRPGFLSSFNASYTVNELQELLDKSMLKKYKLENEFFGLCISGEKNL